MPKKIPKKGDPESHDELHGFDIRINELGEIESTIPIDRLNTFLDKKVEDKKLQSRNLPSDEEE
ncbi:MAG: hypothetical protein OEQ53_03355 [Saprospiraceae bacterium]|nr:hypothetical protein [Saprospiraceae bacterium]